MPKLSVIIITRNEEDNLRRCLDSVAFANEIILCDTGSTDRTVEIAKEFTCRVYEDPFEGFGTAKQKALDRATGTWVLSVDADEEISPELKQSILAVVENGAHDGYAIDRRSQFLGRWILHSGWYPDHVVRLFRRDKGRFSDRKVHERILVDGSIGRLNGVMLHYTYPTLKSYLDKLNRYTGLYSSDMNAGGKRFSIWALIFKPIAYFIKMYILKQGFRDGYQGFVLAVVSSFDVFARFVKLWEIQRR